MAKQQKAKPVTQKGRNDQRRNGKAFKKNPGVSWSAHNGKSVDGYSIKRHSLDKRNDVSGYVEDLELRELPS